MTAGDVDRCLAVSERLVAVARRYDFPTHVTEGQFIGGWARVQHADIVAGVEQIQKAFASKLRHYLAHDSGRLAEALCLAGRESEALAVLNRTLEEAIEPDAGLYLPELHRLRGELMLRLDPASRNAALSTIDAAVALATKMGARALALRAATSRVRIADARLNADDPAATQLRQIYDGFSEGFDGPDLKEAKALLNSLR